MPYASAVTPHAEVSVSSALLPDVVFQPPLKPPLTVARPSSCESLPPNSCVTLPTDVIISLIARLPASYRYILSFLSAYKPLGLSNSALISVPPLFPAVVSLPEYILLTYVACVASGVNLYTQCFELLVAYTDISDSTATPTGCVISPTFKRKVPDELYLLIQL